MLTRFFDSVTRFSLRLNWLIVIFALGMFVLGIFSFLDLNQELVPRVEFPQTIVVAQWSEAEDAEDFLQQVTIPLEEKLRAVEGVVNVESTTNPAFAFIIVRNEFGLIQARIADEITTAIEGTALPETMEFPQVLSFSLTDLPIVTASISSSDLPLEELKALIQEELLPEFESIDEVDQVTVSGGQVLPDETVAVEEDEIVVEAVPEPEPTIEPVPTVDPARLPDLLVQGLQAANIEVEFASDITPDLMRQLTAFGEQGTQGLALLTPGNLRALSPEVIALLPTTFVDTLDGDLRAELDDVAADFGGAAALFEAELAAAAAAAEAAAADEVLTVEPVDLPESWVTALAAGGIEVQTTADLTPAMAGGLAEQAPELLAELEPAQWRALPPETLALLLPVAEADLEPDLVAQLRVLLTVADGGVVEPVELPAALAEGAAAAGLTLATTADLTAELVGQLAGFAPQVFDELTPDMLYALAPEALAALPDEYIQSLDEDVRQTVDNLVVYGTAPVADSVAGPQFAPQPLPESWIAAADAAGVILETTADVDAQTMGLLSSVAPELLLDLEPVQWRALSPAAAAVALAAVPDPLDPVLLAQLQAIQLAAAGETPEAQPLPEEVVAAGAAVGQTLETTADLTPDLLELVAQFAPDFLSQLPVELIPAIAAESLAALPEEAVAALDPDLQQTVTNTILAYEAFQAAEAAPTEEVVEVEPEPTPAPDPARLPEILVQGAAAAGFEIEFADDITPQFMRLFGGLGEQGIQALSLLTPDNLRALDPEVIGLLPAAYLETLDPDLRAELDALAADFGGAGAVAVAEAEEAAALAVGAPTLSGIWIVPAPGGEPSQFQTAADILDNGFLPSAAEFINIFPDSPNVERPAQWMNDLTPDVIAWLEQNEPGFVSNLSPIVLELMAPETLQYMLDSFPEAFDEALALRLAGIAQGEVEAFVPDASITRTNGDPALVLSFFKDGDSNTVAVAERVFEKLDELTATTSLRYEIVFEQASFVEEAINGVFGEMLRGGIFAVLVILFFLSGRVRGRYRLSWRAVIIIGISIPASVLTAFVFMRWIPPLIGAPVSEWAASTNNDAIRFIAQLFPTEFTLNILTLSGLTVAIGRVVDDSIVVLENSYRYIQQGEAPLPATLKATREVAVAIFSATVATMCVFLPLGLVGGLISSFFLPFGLTVAYALAASFGVSITIVPVLIVLLIRRENIPEHREDTPMLRFYTPILEWCLNHRLVTVGVVLLLFVGSLVLLAQLPQSFLPELGEPTVNAVIELPAGTRMQETDELVRQFEERLSEREGVITVQSEVGGGGGVEAFFGGGNVAQNVANLIVAVEERFTTEQEALGDLTAEIRDDAEAVFGAENVTVSAGTIASFGSGLALVLTGLPEDITLEQEIALVADVKAAIGAVDLDGNGNPDVVNVTSNIDDALAGGSAPIIRIDGQPAISFGGEYEFGTSNTIGIVEEARTEITALGILPAGAEVSEGFDSQQQSEGFAGIINAIIWASVLVYLVMALSFRSLVHPFTILFSLPLSLIGAAVALFVTGRVLGISSMVGLLMLVGLVTTNGIVLMVFVKQLKEERGANTYNALLEGGRTRLRPIWMTALATILALVPLALSSEAGAIIAADLAWTVLGGMLVGTILTLVVIPVIYSLIDQGIARTKGLIGRPGASGAAGD